MNFVVDFIFIVGLIALTFAGFNYGMMKVVPVILGMYLGLQVAGIFYTPLANLTSDKSSQTSIYTNQIFWFFGMWVMWSIIFTLVAFSFLGHVYLPKKLANLDQLGGMALGLVAGTFGLLVVGFVIKNTMVMFWFGGGKPDNWLGAIINGFDQSTVFAVFKALKVVYLNVLSPWLPASSMPVFFDNKDFK